MVNKEYEKLKEQLEKNSKWPLLYLFKFITPNENGKIESVKAALPTNGVLTYKHTKNLKYVSVSCKVKMPDAQSIIDIMAAVSKIKGVISL